MKVTAAAVMLSALTSTAHAFTTPPTTSLLRISPTRPMRAAPSMVASHGSIPHDHITFRERNGKPLYIQQAQRYSSRDWLHNLHNLPNSSILHRIRHPVLVITVWSLVVAIVQHFCPIACQIGPKAHSLCGSALGLLLVFRTNAAYNRFWEGRKIWEEIQNQSRNLARIMSLYGEHFAPGRLGRSARLMCAFPHVLIEHLQGNAKPHGQLAHLLNKHDVAELARVQNKPLHVLHRLSREFRALKDQVETDQTSAFSSRERMSFLSRVEKLTESVGACERLVQTPIPLDYVRHTSRFLSLYCLTLPIVLVSELGFAVAPVMAVVTWALFGIQEIGLIIEDPFQRALQLQVIADTIYSDVMETIFINEAVNFQPKAPPDVLAAASTAAGLAAATAAAADGRAGNQAARQGRQPGRGVKQRSLIDQLVSG